jgi:hypothetical protein
VHLLIIIAIGILLPPVAIVGIPVRAAYLVVAARPTIKLLMVLVLVPWAYFVFLIIQHGYIKSAGGITGPTVFPLLWLPLCLVWGAAEQLHKRNATVPMRPTVKVPSDK